MRTSGSTAASKHDSSISATAAQQNSFSHCTHLCVPFRPSEESEIGKKRLLSHNKDNPISYATNLPSCLCNLGSHRWTRAMHHRGAHGAAQPGHATEGVGHCQPLGVTRHTLKVNQQLGWVYSGSGKGASAALEGTERPQLCDGESVPRPIPWGCAELRAAAAPSLHTRSHGSARRQQQDAVPGGVGPPCPR